MENAFSKCEKKITADDVALIEKDLGIALPLELISHYEKFNGGAPQRSLWKDPAGKWEDIEVGNFISLKYRKSKADDPDFTIEGIAKGHWEDGSLPANLLPFARDYGSNFFCIDFLTGKIYFLIVDPWNDALEKELQASGGPRYIAESLSDFVRGLQLNDEDD